MIIRDVIIIGAGASGLMCAATAAARGRRVAVLDHNRTPGAKILITGGGRCNFTNLDIGAGHYISDNPHFVKSALARYTPWDFLDLMTRHGLDGQEKAPGQLFCAQGAKAVLDMLVAECRQAGADIVTGQTVAEVRRVEPDSGFIVRTDSREYACATLVVSSGGLSYRNLGASGLGYDLARQFGLRVTPTRPGLTPLRFNARDRETLSGLSGISCRVKMTIDSLAISDDIVFTPKGLSGPAALRVSSHWRGRDAIMADFLPNLSAEELTRLLASGRTLLRNLMDRFLPGRLAAELCGSLADRRACDLSPEERSKLIDSFKSRPFEFSGTAGYDSAEITVGGVDTGGLSSKTMEAKTVRGLFFTGEVQDVSGDLGGYNLQWAWSSGRAAGEYA